METCNKQNRDASNSVGISSYKYTGMPTDAQRKEINEAVVEIIKYALYGKKEYPKPKGTYSPGFGYLLGQSVRQYIVSEGNIHITKEAKALWDQLFTDLDGKVLDIRVYGYQDRIEAQQDRSGLDKYKGSSKTSEKTDVRKGDKVTFNSFFIQEHTTPVSDMIAALEKLQEPKNEPLDIKDIVSVLDKMHITQMLKKENNNINKNANRIDADYILKKDADAIFNKIIGDKNIGYPKNFVIPKTTANVGSLL